MALMLATLSVLTALAASDIDIRIDALRPGIQISPALYGIFFEEINQAGDGGIYPELLKNRGFERGNAGETPPSWSNGRLDTDAPLNEGKRRSLMFLGEIQNEGYWGVPLRKNARYRLVLWTKGPGAVSATLKAGNRTASNVANLEPTTGWSRREVILTSNTDAKDAKLSLTAEGGPVWLGWSSLKPVETRGKANLRKDLADKVAAMKPAFVRFPGGCFVEGQRLDRAFDWKATIGPSEERPGKDWRFWGYASTDGLGYHEYLQWCEDLGAEALFVANCGMSHEEVQPMSGMDKYVQDTLDAIEYANGPITSKWGMIRAKNGHMEPFNLRYVEIGNENGGPAYNERYALIAKAVKEKYPDIITIANVWGGTPDSYPIEVLDEHYYSNPGFFWQNSDRYDKYDRKGPKIYVGEYAVTQGSGTGNLAAALGEAAFMTGMERNSDVVTMSSYAPLFVNINNKQWNPDAIVFDNNQSYGTPSYWVQVLFGQNRPDRLLPLTMNVPVPPTKISGGVGLQTWRTHAEFKDLSVEVGGKTTGVKTFTDLRGTWKVDESTGTAVQEDLQQDRRAIAKDVRLEGSKKFTIRLKARKVAGDEGFIIMFGLGGDQPLQWNLGGWGNETHAFQLGAGGPVNGVPGNIETGRWYDIRLEGEGSTVRGYLDDKLIQELTVPATKDFAAVAGIDMKNREVVVKMVNRLESARDIRLDFGGRAVADTGTQILLTGPSMDAENSFDKPKLIAPKTSVVQLGRNGSYRQPARSLSILRLKLK